jgi:hypothetical protein
MPYRLIADAILVIHSAIVLFIVGGLVMIWIGYALKWHWVRSWLFRIMHLAAMAIVTIQAMLSRICPLTEWESSVRIQSGQKGYPGSFVQYWLHKVLFYEWPGWTFRVLYGAVLGLIILAWFAVRPGKSNQASSNTGNYSKLQT